MNAENLTHEEVLSNAVRGRLEARNVLFGNVWCDLVYFSALTEMQFSIIPAYTDNIVFGEVVGSQSSKDRLFMWLTTDCTRQQYFSISDLRLKTPQSDNVDNHNLLYMDSERNIFLRPIASSDNFYTDRKIFIGYVVQEPPNGFCVVTYFKNKAVSLDSLLIFIKQKINKNVLVVEGQKNRTLKFCYTQLCVEEEPTTMKFVEFRGMTLAMFIGREHERQLRGGTTVCTSYAHIGQHGDASTTLRKCKASTTSQYTSLLRELATISDEGYMVNVRNTE